MEHHISTLIPDLALILGVGAIVTLLFRKIKQPLVLGYIIAGFLIGPRLDLIPSVSDGENIKTLADIGVIFLLFGLGLEFSFKKLMRVGGSASITALVEIILITLAGYLFGRMLGWSQMDCLFLGGMLASSSTTIIIRAFDELGVKGKIYSRVVFGVLVVEDIVVILLMVLLSTIALTKQFEGSELLFTVGKLSFFIILWFILGIYLIPSFLKRIKKLMDDEGYLVLSIGLCLAMVIVAVEVGFSAELGAFIMGSVLAETVCAEKIEHIIKPVKDLFGAIFFVSVGMMIDPAAIKEYGWIVVAVTLLVIIGKIASTTVGAILSGQPLKQSVQVGMSMAQIGEFAFIVAALGMNLGVTSEFLFPVAVSVSAVTTFTTPYFIKYSENLYGWVERLLPAKWLAAINRYSESARTIQAESEWKKFVKSYFFISFNNGVIVIAVMLLGINALQPFLHRWIESGLLVKFLTLSATLGISFPFIWASMFKLPGDVEYKDLWGNDDYNRGPLLIMGGVRLLFAMFLIGYFVYFIFVTYHAIVIVLPAVAIALYFASKRMKNLYGKLENRFMANYLSREIAEASAQGNIIRQEFIPHAKRSSWNITLIDLEISQDVEYAGKDIGELTWREEYGINIAYIKRGESLIYAPGRKDKLLPFDHIGVIATDEQLEVFMPVFSKKEEVPHTHSNVDDITIQKFVIDEACPLNGLDIRRSGIRERTGGLVVGVERDTEHFLNPSPNTVFETNDIVWIVGLKNKLHRWNN
ncbi:sodium:proton antiporter [Bacteroidia bacterium]|nr:sodium:proton antiporter [Bacteroidia bacterium]